jgi:hypothetical protein
MQALNQEVPIIIDIMRQSLNQPNQEPKEHAKFDVEKEYYES